MLQVFDDVLPDPVAYRARVLAQPFGDVDLGVTFHGIAPAPDNSLVFWLAQEFPTLRAKTTCCRLSPEGQQEPHLIHDDRSMGDWSAILYLTPDPPLEDGTDFWMARHSGAKASTTIAESAEWLAEGMAWFDVARWERWCHVAARFNRLVLFKSAYFHSRALERNYGQGDTAMLRQLVFLEGAWSC
jgi:hypothetical protein